MFLGCKGSPFGEEIFSKKICGMDFEQIYFNLVSIWLVTGDWKKTYLAGSQQLQAAQQLANP